MSTDKNLTLLMAMHQAAINFIKSHEDLIPEGRNTLHALEVAIIDTERDELAPMHITRINVDGNKYAYPTDLSINMLRLYENGIGMHTGLIVTRKGDCVEYQYNKRFESALKKQTL